MEALFDMMKTIYKAQITPSTITFNHLLKAYFRLNKYEEDMRLFREMLEKFHGAYPPTYVSTIEGFYLMQLAANMYLEMRRRGSIFSELVFCNLIQIFFKEGEV